MRNIYQALSSILTKTTKTNLAEMQAVRGQRPYLLARPSCMPTTVVTPTTVAGVKRLAPSVILCVCPHDNTKTAETKNDQTW